MQEATDDGHCGLPVEDLVKLATTLLEVDESIVRIALAHQLAGDEIVADTIENRPCVFLRGLYLAERGIAERLQALSKGSPPWPRIDIDKAVPWVEKKTDKTLADKVAANPSYLARAGAVLIKVNDEIIGVIGVGGARPRWIGFGIARLIPGNAAILALFARWPETRRKEERSGRPRDEGIGRATAMADQLL